MTTTNSNEWNELINHERHRLNFDDVSIIVEDGVFTPNPAITQTPWIIIENFPNLKGKCVADVGTGTGIIAIMAAKHGAKEVIATDIDEKAVTNASKNVENNNVNEVVKVVKTNLLENISVKFDYIFANLPIDSEIWAKQNISVKSTMQVFFEQVKSKVKVGGKIYVPQIDFAKEAQESLEMLLKSANLKFTRISKNALNHTWYLYVIEEQNIN